MAWVRSLAHELPYSTGAAKKYIYIYIYIYKNHKPVHLKHDITYNYESETNQTVTQWKQTLNLPQWVKDPWLP